MFDVYTYICQLISIDHYRNLVHSLGSIIIPYFEQAWSFCYYCSSSSQSPSRGRTMWLAKRSGVLLDSDARTAGAFRNRSGHLKIYAWGKSSPTPSGLSGAPRGTLPALALRMCWPAASPTQARSWTSQMTVAPALTPTSASTTTCLALTRLWSAHKTRTVSMANAFKCSIKTRIVTERFAT